MRDLPHVDPRFFPLALGPNDRLAAPAGGACNPVAMGLDRGGGDTLYAVYDLGLSTGAGTVRIANIPGSRTFYVSLDHYQPTTAEPLRWTQFQLGEKKQ